MYNQFYFKQFTIVFFVYTQLNVKTVLFQTIQFSISTQFCSIWPIYRTLSGAISPSQSGPGSDGNDRVLHILKSSSITWVSPADCFVSKPGHSPEGSHSLQKSCRCICYGDISYYTPKMDSSNLNIFSELSSLGGDIFSFLTRHLTDGLQAEHG